jgi:mannobiose 2-epimerase
MTPDHDALAGLADAARAELTDHILPYWSGRAVDPRHGGFVGRIDGADRLVPGAPKGSVLNARILWTFAAAGRTLQTERWRPEAERALHALQTAFRDPVHGGVYWTVTAEGAPLDDKKQVYAQAFTIYGLAEYVRLTGSPEALAWATELFDLLEARAVDPAHGGYLEAFSREWGPLGDVRLSEKDRDAPKSMNTHLHVLEAYTTLYRVWPDPALADRIRALLHLFLDHIIEPATGVLVGFFESDWTPVPSARSFGHDIEASWLLDEAAAVLGDEALAETVAVATLRLARLTHADGLDEDGALFYEQDADGRFDTDKHWWPQAEAVVGFLNAYERSGEEPFAAAALGAWRFIQTHIVDRAGGEWHFRVSRDGTPVRAEDKLGIWKCPYHNSRACLEILARASAAVPA